jgi:tRNA pseudouridine55 synthase
MTSFGVVARIRRMLSEQEEGKGAARATDLLRARRDEEKPSVVPYKRKRLKVGHTGTLDPFATGLMIIVVGKECKNAQLYSKKDKIYEATIRLGQSSTTGDPEGEITDVSDIIPTLDHVKEALNHFTGEIVQRPPIYSAIKIGGERAYKLARAGKSVEMPERHITVHSLDLIEYAYPTVKVRAHVSSGTYIRTLAEDIGQYVGTGAYCYDLRRTHIDTWSVDDAQTLQEFGVTNP